ncbi:MAG: ABC transporter permease [Flavobacterium sp.]|nr:ABC transporter permease [Flavobacterium sp.]
MNFSLYIAKRYLFSKSKNNAINIISRIAAAGIVISAMSLFVVLSVFSGLRDFSTQFTNSLDPDLKLNATTGKSFTISAKQALQLKKLPEITNFSKIIEERVLFNFVDKQMVTYLKGVDSNFVYVNGSSKKLFSGFWLKPDTYQVVIGYGIATKLSLGLLDFNNQFEVYVPKPGKGTIENEEDAFNKSVLIPVGIYNISDDLDSKYVFADLKLTQDLLQYSSNQVSGIEIKLKLNSDKDAAIQSITAIFNNKVQVKTREQLNETMYKMLNTENVAVYLIFTLVIIIALFNLIGALIMMILDKKNNLKTLTYLGAKVASLRSVFLLHGVLLSFIGGVFGILLGIGVVIFQQQTNFIMVSESLPYPVIFNFFNLFVVLATIVLLGFAASLIASSRVTKKLLN